MGACSSSSHKLYDAFINHRGPDTKDTIAFALYELLEEKGFWTFLDVQELQPGDSIEPAINNAISYSTVQIAIFSPGYAKSPWCLNELVHMLKTKALFIPVFCDVRPADLRYPDNGAYKAAFAEHKKKGRFTKKKLQDWKAALYSSSLISGYEFNTSNENVEELCARISLDVQRKVGEAYKGFPRYLEDAEAGASTSISAQVKVKKSSLLTRDSHPVGIDSKVEDIVGLLENPQVQVVAVVGMGGSGKTFLLQYVYRALRSRFDTSIWLSISNYYSVEKLQHDIASHIGLNIASVSEERAAEMINKRLEGKRCLVVLDDLWRTSREDNIVDKLGLQDCKIVLSTRNRKVAVDLSARTYEMKKLSDKDSWELFCAYAFPDCGGNRAPLHLEKVGHEIVKQCGNLAIAIKTTAASLASDTDIRKWRFKLRQLEKALVPLGEHNSVMEILKLSYDSLPVRLKACFAYLSFFPEDAKIDCEYLVYLWIAEGFIPAEAGEDQWDTAWDWLDHLAQLCLIQVWEEEEGQDSYHYSKSIKYCNIHDLLHDLVINISRKNRCVFSLNKTYTYTSGASSCCRILVAKKDINDDALSRCRPAYLRSLSLSQNYNLTSIPASFFTSLRGLRILDLRRTGITTLPESIGKMILLKVLNLRFTRIKELPESVRHLKSLSFLALPSTIDELPLWTSDLKCLQHLECVFVCHIPRGISNIVSLRTLRSGCLRLSTAEDEFMRLEDLSKMTQLHELNLQIENEMQKVEDGILARLTKIRYLKMDRGRGCWTELLRLPEKIRAMEHLESLKLYKFALPNWICDLANLRQLCVHAGEFIECRGLEKLSNLVRLDLNEARYTDPNFKRCTELPKAFGKSGGFPQLRFFRITGFFGLEEFPELEEGAMPNLEVFHLKYCLGIKKVLGLERLKRLKVFQHSACSELRETFKKGGRYWNQIKDRNPNVIITSDYSVDFEE